MQPRALQKVQVFKRRRRRRTKREQQKADPGGQTTQTVVAKEQAEEEAKAADGNWVGFLADKVREMASALLTSSSSSPAALSLPSSANQPTNQPPFHSHSIPAIPAQLSSRQRQRPPPQRLFSSRGPAIFGTNISSLLLLLLFFPLPFALPASFRRRRPFQQAPTRIQRRAGGRALPGTGCREAKRPWRSRKRAGREGGSPQGVGWLTWADGQTKAQKGRGMTEKGGKAFGPFWYTKKLPCGWKAFGRRRIGTRLGGKAEKGPGPSNFGTSRCLFLHFLWKLEEVGRWRPFLYQKSSQIVAERLGQEWKKCWTGKLGNCFLLTLLHPSFGGMAMTLDCLGVGNDKQTCWEWVYHTVSYHSLSISAFLSPTHTPPESLASPAQCHCTFQIPAKHPPAIFTSKVPMPNRPASCIWPHHFFSPPTFPNPAGPHHIIRFLPLHFRAASFLSPFFFTYFAAASKSKANYILLPSLLKMESSPIFASFCFFLRPIIAGQKLGLCERKSCCCGWLLLAAAGHH